MICFRLCNGVVVILRFVFVMVFRMFNEVCDVFVVCEDIRI